LNYTSNIFDSGVWTNNGPLVKELEAKLSKIHNQRQVIAFSSGFWALVHCVKEIALSGKNHALIPSLTYRRLDDVVSWSGLVPVICDVDFDSYTLSIEEIRKNFSSQVGLIVLVQPMVKKLDRELLLKVQREFKVPILVDSVENQLRECKFSHNLDDFTRVYSMHASKQLNAAEGGYVVTGDMSIAENLRLIRGFGFKGIDNVEIEEGYNSKLNEMHAALALANLDVSNQLSNRQQHLSDCYQRLNGILPGISVEVDADKCCFNHKNILLHISSKTWILNGPYLEEILRTEGFMVRRYYNPPLHKKNHLYKVRKEGSFENSEILSDTLLTIPTGLNSSLNDVEKLADLIQLIYENQEDLLSRFGHLNE